MTNDMMLIQKACEGDSRAFSSLLARHYDKMFALAYKLTGNYAWAEDITQDVCMRLPARLHSFEGKSKVTTWLYRIVVNATHDYRRKQASQRRIGEVWGEVEVDRRQADEEKCHAHMWLKERLKTLPLDIRDTVVLVVFEDMTHAQVGACLGISEGTVSWRMSEAKKHLRVLKEQEDE